MPAGPGDRPTLGSPGWRLVPCRPDWDEAYLAAMAEDEYPGDADLYEDPDNAPPAGLDDTELAALVLPGLRPRMNAAHPSAPRAIISAFRRYPAARPYRCQSASGGSMSRGLQAISEGNAKRP